MDGAMNGVIEGFYGTPWTWGERRQVADAVAAAGMDTYVYAPKDDPLHRDRWRDPYDDAQLGEFEAFGTGGPTRLGFAISPGLSIDPDSEVDRASLVAKLEQVIDVGVDLVALTLDDLPFHEGQGAEHGALTSFVRDALDANVQVVLVPNDYTGMSDSPYLGDLVTRVPAEVPIAWTGPTVVCDRITREDVERWSAATGGRAPLLWDNVPVNDMLMADRLFPGPLRGRDPDVPPLLSGYLGNPMIQAAASVPALISAATWFEGGDPEHTWEAAIGGARVLADCCGQDPTRALVDAALADRRAVDELEEFLQAAAACSVGQFGAAAQPWADEIRRAASVGLSAVELLRATGHGGVEDLAAATQLAFAVGVTWPAVRAASISVFGPRAGFRPFLSHGDTGEWICHRGSFEIGQNAIDHLCGAALARLPSN